MEEELAMALSVRLGATRREQEEHAGHVETENNEFTVPESSHQLDM